LLLIIFKNR